MRRMELLESTVGHTRHHPKQHSFSYKVYYVITPVTETPYWTPFFFSFERFNIFSIFGRDHGARDGSGWRPWITKECAEHGVTISPDDTVLMISHPRLFGFAFNPISFWLVYEKDLHIKAVLCEVRNTFGDNHNYFLMHPEGRAITPADVFTAEKHLYVSPFNHMSPSSYTFTFEATPEKFKSVINYFENSVHILNAYMGGRRRPLTNRAILGAIVKYPLMTLMVVVRIHWQALKLYIKGVKPTLSEMPPPTSGGTTAGTLKQD